jgi:hypothetical protein
MIPAKTGAVNRKNGMGRLRKLLVPLAAMLVLSGLLASPVAAAPNTLPQSAVGYYTRDGQTFLLYPGEDVDVMPPGTTLSQLEAMHPMSAAAEKAIVHQIPPCPVVVDGVRCAAQDISKFNGIRLGFIMGSDGTLYAFTTAEGLEQFQQESAAQVEPLQATPDSVFYKDWLFGGDRIGITPGIGLPDLSQIAFDKCISSVQVSTLASQAALFEETNYGGDYFVMQSGSNHSILALEGWNDRASSVIVS